MIQTRVFALGKQVGDEPVADEACEGPQNPTGLDVPARRERESFQADHGITAPVGEPVVPGDDAALLISKRMSACGIRRTASRADDELAGGQYELCRRVRLRLRVGSGEKLLAPCALR